MTTIAFKAHRDGSASLAADTQVSCGGRVDASVVKIRQRGPVLAAAAGTLTLAQGFLDWFGKGMDLDNPPDMGGMKDEDPDATGVIFLPDNQTILTFTPTGVARTQMVSGCYAFGSGGEVALGAMMAGASPERAIRITSRVDLFTGGQVMVVRRAADKDASDACEGEGAA